MKRRTMWEGGIVVAALLAAGCGGNFDPISRVASARLLAVGADAPYAAPGTEVHLDALAHDPSGRTLTWGWALCPEPTATTVAGCIDELDWSTFQSAEGMTTFQFVVPPDALDARPPEARPQASYGVVVALCPGDLSAPEPRPKILATGSLPFVCRDRATGRELARDEFVVGLKRIFVRATDRNANPTATGVTWDGVDWPEGEVKTVSACPSTGFDYQECTNQSHAIAPTLAGGAVETGVDAFGNAFTEQVIVAYYTAGGVFEHDLRVANAPETRWAGQGLPGQESKIWIVVRDDRGGVGWIERSVRAQ